MTARPEVEPRALRRPGEVLVLRPATTADLPALVRLETEAFTGDRLSPRSLRRLLAGPTGATIVSVADGRVVGYALVLFRKDAKVARLYSLARDRAWQGRGVGGRLLEAAEAEAGARGVDELRLEVRADNVPARALYMRHGYVEMGVRRAYYHDGMDAVRMRKRLGDPTR